MTTRRYTRRTPEQRKQQAKQLHENLQSACNELSTPETWEAYFKFLSEFHDYSIRNQILIFTQCPQATHVAGYRQWQEKGFQVRKGEKAIKIFGRFTGKTKDDDSNTTTEETEANEGTYVYYPVLSVFDISQVDPITPEAEDNYKKHFPTSPNTTDMAQIVANLTSYLKAEQWQFTLNTSDDTEGWVIDEDARTIAIDSDADNSHTLLELFTVIGENYLLAHNDADAIDYKHEALVAAYLVGIQCELPLLPPPAEMLTEFDGETETMLDALIRIRECEELLTTIINSPAE